MGEKWPTNFAIIWRVPQQIKGSLICHKSVTWDRWLYFPSEGRHAEDFFALKNLTASASMLTTRPPKPLPRGRVEVYSTLSLVLALDGCGWSMPLPSRFAPDKKYSTHFTRWTTGLVWTCAENLMHTGIQSPDSLACSESLYQLLYPTLHTAWYARELTVCTTTE
jgi:hypothetical protein